MYLINIETIRCFCAVIPVVPLTH